jgi:hypothetical protein
MVLRTCLNSFEHIEQHFKYIVRLVTFPSELWLKVENTKPALAVFAPGFGTHHKCCLFHQRPRIAEHGKPYEFRMIAKADVLYSCILFMIHPQVSLGVAPLDSPIRAITKMVSALDNFTSTSNYDAL